LSFKDNILTIGTGVGIMMFYDIRAGKYLESIFHKNKAVVLNSSDGYLVCIICINILIILFYDLIFVNRTLKTSTYTFMMYDWTLISRQFSHIATIIQEQDYFPEEDQCILIYVETTQVYGNNNSSLILKSFYTK